MVLSHTLSPFGKKRELLFLQAEAPAGYPAGASLLVSIVFHPPADRIVSVRDFRGVWGDRFYPPILAIPARGSGFPGGGVAAGQDFR